MGWAPLTTRQSTATKLRITNSHLMEKPAIMHIGFLTCMAWAIFSQATAAPRRLLESARLFAIAVQSIRTALRIIDDRLFMDL
mmetsp:Transcript_30928/g.72118  ORF Transcript_30928/g.72118 Transcript_30928/m.72118 type:complete len:83 (+) Transcript_30928:1838-2086(+)